MTHSFKKGDAVLVVTRLRSLGVRVDGVSYVATTVRNVHSNGNLYLETDPKKQVRVAWGNVVADTKKARAELDAEAATYKSICVVVSAAYEIETRATKLRRVVGERRNAVPAAVVDELKSMVARLGALAAELEVSDG